MSERSRELVRYVLPSLLSSVSIFLFTIVDGVFVGRGIGGEALAAINIVFPYVMIFTAALLCTSVGGMTVCAIRMGRGDTEGANRVFRYSFWADVAIGSVMSVVGTVFAGPIVRLLGATESFYQYAYDYQFWYSLFLLPCGLMTALGGFCRNDGSPGLVSAVTVATIVLNIIGDWLLIFPLGLGTAGAAIATVGSQTVGAILLLLLHFARRKGVLTIGRIRREEGLFGRILLRGLPECVAQFSAPVSIILMNRILGEELGDAAVKSFAIMGYVASFAVASFAGISEGLQPLFGRCYGAGKKDDLHYYLNWGLAGSFIGSVIIIAALYFVSDPVCDLYAADAETRAVTLVWMPRYSWGFAVEALNVIASSYLYSTTHTREALTVNVLRSFVLDTLVTLAMIPLFGRDSIWYSFLAYEGLVLIVSAFLLIRSERRGIMAGAKE